MYGSGDAGLYMGNSPYADFTIKDNTAHDDLWGILVRDSSTGRVTGNTLHDNCSGLVFLNTGVGTGVKDWVATDNSANHNNNSCPGSATGLPFTLTGLGILIAGGQHIVLRDNTVRANQPGGPPTTVNGVALSGGSWSSPRHISRSSPMESWGATPRATPSWTTRRRTTYPSTSPTTDWALAISLGTTSATRRLRPDSAPPIARTKPRRPCS